VPVFLVEMLEIIKVTENDDVKLALSFVDPPFFIG
jgi:hypothetical protein